MAFQTPLTIREVISNIDTKKYLLPSIQREFVWSTSQITRLFDSLMRGYPINSFLFWEVDKDNTKEFRFYEFLRNYHQRKNRHNEKASLNGCENITAILDGQQRLTSLYIGLKGSYAYKLPHKKYSNDQAYPTRRLYLNLLNPSDNPDCEYGFEFLTDEEARQNDKDHYWFKVGDILDFKEQSDVITYLISNGLVANEDKNKADFANKTIFKLHAIVHIEPIISYYLEKSKELDKVLNIFIRVNSGGTTLSYSDLLLSFATAQWEKRDAREEINRFVDEINEIGNGFNVNKDFVLKACLVLSDFSDISFKVDNFNKTNMVKIEDNWEDITKAIRDAVRLIASFGFNRDNMTSNNLIIPIAYYLKHIGLPDNFEVSSSRISDRAKIKKWFTLTLLKRVFSLMPDGALKPIREIIRNNDTNEFPLESIINHFRGTNRTLVFTKEDVSNLLYTKCGSGDTLVILSILYPWADLRNNFHVDHIFPKSLFTRKRLEKRGVKDMEIEKFIEKYNYIGNLQLLEAIPNIEKNNKEFDKWLNETLSKEAIDYYKIKHYIPKGIDLDFLNFLEFLQKREELILNKLEDELL
ncbi:DUF262 domain-containing protein [Paraclostridium sordellii]|uniref:DUF262 domain-containing protein n=1 Tax=Paraclostridium sordellii TaxID=1505 RepID=UPI0005E67F2F|nr:DUF262 domain-containing protein [Paeniclostridium sordellii]CEQ17843.1 Uncharacterized conserved protein [[Clostridium] sordellii] [Paeniclostridium sordellii]